MRLIETRVVFESLTQKNCSGLELGLIETRVVFEFILIVDVICNFGD